MQMKRFELKNSNNLSSDTILCQQFFQKLILFENGPKNKFIWGADEEDFRPKKWLDENGSSGKKAFFKFTAFQAGPRICLGKEFAYRKMKIFSTVLLGSFVFKLSDDKKALT
ncbi:cytochrome P450, family 704, subfamily A, polypeptide 2 [Actinidia rufa]|uniref:Cytochrome P450, family 704, subfamily A, polypeptide 2 n=1 Tax=Actinidia rufa TaxID=165716 RepID=A0A7J0EUA1_9ERIC|nr:cytochrome P450, family 704, subfamily A, polypeptide 2 [Actinidia rufa]